MIELPETYVLSEQVNQTLIGKTIAAATANTHPHAFAAYTEDPSEYNKKLVGKKISGVGLEGHPCANVKIICEDMDALFCSVKSTLLEMKTRGGRDTEKDLFGLSGGYQTFLSGKTIKHHCRVCGGGLIREAFLGGNIYYCPVCQPLII